MPYINNNFYKIIRAEFKQVYEQFPQINRKYDHVMTDGDHEDLFDLMDNCNDFYSETKNIRNEIQVLLESQTLIQKQGEYEEMQSEIESMLSQVEGMYKDAKDLCIKGGGFSEIEDRTYRTFEIDLEAR